MTAAYSLVSVHVCLRAYFYATKICIQCRPSLYIFRSLIFYIFLIFAGIKFKVSLLISLLYMPNKVLPSFCWNLHLTLVHCHTRFWSHDHKGNNTDVVFCFGCFSEDELAEPLLPKSSQNDRLVDFSSEPPVSGVASSINNSLSDDTCLLSLADGVVSSAGQRSFT